MVGVAVWKGTASNDWSLNTNWICGATPKATDDVVIPAGTPYSPYISGAQTNFAKDITINSGATLVIDNGILKISGYITNNGTFDAINFSTIELAGTTTQTIAANTFTNNSVPNLIISNVQSVILQGPLDITNLLSLFTGTLYTNGYITLKSNAANTARVDQVKSAAANPIVGDVTVERYVPGRRKYRLIAPSVTTSTQAVLTAGQEDKSIWGNWQNAGVSTTQNIGTLITGGDNADGFDPGTTNASLFTYNSSTKRMVAISTANGKNTKYTPLVTGTAYYMFVYGDRQNSIGASSPRATVLKAKGTLAVGPQTFNTTSAIPLTSTVNNFTLIGNPYACTIDWKSVQKAGVGASIWSWDANLNSTGGYVTVTATATGALVSPISPLVQVSRYIQPGQGFFVLTTTSTPQIIINEANKINNTTSINSNVFRTATTLADPSVMAINLLYTSNATTFLADGAVAAFDSTYKYRVTDEDGIKMTNSGESVALLEGLSLLSIDGRPIPKNNDTLLINITRLTKPQYTLEVFTKDYANTSLTPYLEDSYLNTIEVLSIVDTNRIVFNVNTTIPASAAADRFRIVWRENSTLPVKFISVAATLKTKKVTIDWKVAQETGIKYYVVERSANGSNYTMIGEIAAKGSLSSDYNWLDPNPADGNNYYRIKAVQPDGQFFYSETALVKTETAKAGMLVFPNPVINNKLSITLSTLAKGNYKVLLFNTNGAKVFESAINHNGGSGNYNIALQKELAKGFYYLQLINKDVSFSQSIILE